ncbi:DUF5908 family protein [Vitiosangium sp. GDMCC 1.1324]|uniref:DUF5908 family protein n=1 Tax=Vitiosangium sp. (strain GDMCC 1.1324) TaxID=2138576 RepID=UPI0018EEAFA9|nr:DUF5908 family protein [Vitiosangium sp. GDMCC 1.1324]
MPVEIKELVIRAVVQQEGARGDVPTADALPSAADQEAIIEAAVREVLRILKASKER